MQITGEMLIGAQAVRGKGAPVDAIDPASGGRIDADSGVRFNGGDLLHMVPAIYSGGMDANGNPVGDANYDICESALGRRASHGWCWKAPTRSASCC